MAGTEPLWANTIGARLRAVGWCMAALSVTLWLSRAEVLALNIPTIDCQVIQRSAAPHDGAWLAPPVKTTGTNSLIYFRVRFPTDQQEPISLQDAEQTLTDVSNALGRISEGKFSLAWTISPVLHLAKPPDAYADAGGFQLFLDDVREAGLAAGYDYRNFDLDIARHSGVPGFQGGNANLGARGAQVQADGAMLIVHELGHNLGLPHANLWVTGSLGLSLGSPPMPSNYQELPDPRSIPIYPDSALGHESITGPGYAAEYGDTADIMGSGTVEFSAIYRHSLGWLPETAIATAPKGLSIHRLTAGHALPTEPYSSPALRVSGLIRTPLGERQYWVQIPPKDAERVFVPGVQVRWADASPGRAESMLLSPLAGSPGLSGGTILPPGRTFSDPLAGVHITLLEWNESEVPSVEVAVFNGAVPGNQHPGVDLTAWPTSAATNQVVSFSAAAIDPDGDELAWRWDFGDGTSSTRPASVSKFWRRTGDFSVVLEVSDLRGGLTRRQVTVRVGNPRTLRISGRVLTPAGDPVQGVRVHNGLVGAVSPDRRAISTFTDADGAYSLTDLHPGTYTNGAFLFGYRIDRQVPVTLTDADRHGVDFVATPLAHVSVTAQAALAEGAGPTNLFTISRTGPTTSPLTVLYQLGGTATGGRDYAKPLLDRVIIPAGAASTSLLLDIFDDQVAEGLETVSLSVTYPVSEQRLDEAGHLFTTYYPGWEFVTIDGQPNWVLTDPLYVPGPAASATVVIQDDDAPAAQVVSLSAADLSAIEEPLVESSFRLSRVGAVSEPLRVHVRAEGSAENGLDYERLETTIEFAPGETEKTLAIVPIVDGLDEGEEQVALTVLPDPTYGVESGAATVTIRDTAAITQRLSATRLLDGTLQLTMKARAGSRLVLEANSQFSGWTPVRTNLFFNTDTATVVLPISKQPVTVYRTIQLAD